MTERFSHLNLKFNGKNSFSIRFRIYSHSAAQKWALCLKEASTRSRILEADRWYNFPGKKLASLESLATELQKVITGLNQIHAGLITESLDPRNLQASVNRLHVHFADSHLVQKRITAESHDLWFQFNNLLHAFESVERSQQVEAQSGIPNASIIFTWEDNCKKPLEESDYHEFTVAKKFGTCYINYCQVGRHLFEVFQAQDTDLSHEHIRPLESASADTYLWLGPSTGPQGLKKKMAAIEDWYLKNQKSFGHLGMNWGDPKLAIGWIPVASLETDISSPLEQKALIDRINLCDKLESCTVETT